MKKDIEWLKEKIKKLPVKYYGFSILKHKDEYMVDKDEVIRLIDQLDELESVETEVKSKQELIEKWESAIESAEFYGKGKEERLISYMKDFVSDLSQLDEPEVLSQEWIEDKQIMKIAPEGVVYYVVVDDLQNLLVPKQEEVDRAYKDCYEKGKECTFYKGYLAALADKEREQEKVVVPQFVADWIEEAKDRELTLYGAIHECPREVSYWLVDGDSSNQETFARAWLDGYEVEEEQKYRILDGNTTLLGSINGLVLPTVEILEYYPEYAPTFDLTEREIKDYDSRYWPFAVPVEVAE